MEIIFITNSILLGFGLAMDAFSVSIANGLTWPRMSGRRMCLIAGTYGFFQFAMPMIGWYCVRTASAFFTVFQKFIPWIALILLVIIGGKMIIESLKKNTPADGLREREGSESEGPDDSCSAANSGTDVLEARGKTPEALPMLGIGALLIQGVATSIDALSVGFTTAGYGAGEALISSLLIAVTTFIICMIGLVFGKRFGEHLADRASIAGGIILIAIGLEIFIRGVFF